MHVTSASKYRRVGLLSAYQLLSAYVVFVIYVHNHSLLSVYNFEIMAYYLAGCFEVVFTK